MVTPRAVDLLVTHGAGDIAHPGGTLLAHLQRVGSRLGDWGARPAVQVAGLCHAFYGTDGFDTSLLDVGRRADLATVIGEEAESLVYFYASCDRQASYPTLADEDALFRDRFTGDTFTPPVQRRRDFAEITAANELDLVLHSPDMRARWGEGLARLFTRWQPLLSDSAQRDCRESLPGG